MRHEPNPYPVGIHPILEEHLPPRPLKFNIAFRPLRGEYCDITMTSHFDGKQNSYYSSNVSWFVDTLKENINGHINVILSARVMARALTAKKV